MKKFLFLFLVAFSVITLIGCGGTYEIALVTDKGNIDDKSFNEGAWRGVETFAKERGISYNYFRPLEDSKNARIEQMENAIAKGAKIIVCPGYLFEEAIYDLQGKYPEVAFLLLDGQPHNADYTVYETKDNVHNILYKEEQAGFLAGYAAVKEGFRKLGFIGGVDVPPVIRYGYGYVLGIEAAATELNLSNVEVKYNYVGDFAPSDALKSKMDGWYTAGTEVVFACGGAIYMSVTQSAAEKNKKVIGVDSDQANVSETIITSAMKDLTLSVKEALESFFDNEKKWDEAHAGETATLGANEDGIGLAVGDSWKLENFTIAEYNTLFNKIKSGEIVVSNNIDEHPTVTKITVDWAA